MASLTAMEWSNKGWEMMSAVGAAVGALAAVIGLIYVMAQVRWARKAIRANAVQSLGTQILQVGQWLTDHPEHRNSLYLEEDVESRHAEAAATVVADFISHVLSQRDVPKDQLEAWDRYFIDLLNERPQVRKLLSKRGHWYGKAMDNLRAKHAQQFEQWKLDRSPLAVTPIQTDESVRGGTRENPFPIGHPVHNEEWQVRLDDPCEAGDIVAANKYNDPPEAGMEYWIVPVTATYTGDTTGKLNSIAVKFVSDNRNYDHGYGAAIPDPLYEIGALFNSGTAKGNVCVAVPAGANGLWTVSMGSDRPIFFRSEPATLGRPRRN